MTISVARRRVGFSDPASSGWPRKSASAAVIALQVAGAGKAVSSVRRCATPLRGQRHT